jgi:putative tryptophan/tyrosine transport system substrate-binding protein
MNRVRGAPAQNLPRPIVPPLPYRGIARGALQVGRLPAHGRTAQACSGRRGIYPALAVPHLAGGLDALQSARVDAVNVLASPVISPARASIIDRLNRARLPAIYEAPEIAESGGLLGYGTRFDFSSRLVARLASKILRGARPEDLPIEQPDRFDLVINLKTAKALGITVPPALLVRADKVIE